MKQIDNLILEHVLTDRCNLNCIHCYKKQINTFRKELNYNNIIDFYNRYNPKEVHITGGEPLLYGNINEICSLLYSKNIPVYLQSNGLLLTDEFIKSSSIKMITISIDGLMGSHSKIRGVDNFRHLLSIATLNRKINVNCVVQSSNLADIPFLISLFNQNQIKYKLLLEHFITSAEIHEDNMKLSKIGAKIVTKPKAENLKTIRLWNVTIDYILSKCAKNQMSFNDKNITGYWNKNALPIKCKKIRQNRLRLSPDGYFIFCEHINLKFGMIDKILPMDIFCHSKYMELKDIIENQYLNVCKRCCKGE